MSDKGVGGPKVRAMSDKVGETRFNAVYFNGTANGRAKSRMAAIIL